MNENEIIIYQPDSSLSLNVRVENETVWLSQAQMTELFHSSKQNVSLHINNIFKEGELDRNSVVKDFLTTAADGKNYKTKHYSLDVIISVGYRVKSLRGTQFRQWANKVLKDHMLRGYSINEQLIHVEHRIDCRLSDHDLQLKDLSGKVDFLLKTTLPPNEGVLFDGQIFDVYLFICDLIRRAQRRIILIDNYVDETVLALLQKRNPGVSATIYTRKPDRTLMLDLERHNGQYSPITIQPVQNCHDRFLIIDDTLYHIGASVKDLGKKLFAFSRMEMSPSTITERLFAI